MRILHLYKDYFPVLGGIENHIKVLAEAQTAAGHEVEVLVCADGMQPVTEKINNVPVRRQARLATLRSMPISPALVRQAARARSDIVHVHSPFPLGEFALRHLPPSVRVVATHHSDVVRQKLLLKFYAPFYRQFLKRVDLILPTSEPYRDSSPWLAALREKCRVVPLGVDSEHFSPAGRRPPGSSPGLRLLFVGRLRYYKGLDTLLRALPHLPPQVELSIVGRGNMERAWQSLTAELGLQERVRFCGDLDDSQLLQAYREADLFVLPCNCRAEAFGTVLLEAMACGLPCITSDVGSGTSWVVADGTTGIVVPPSDIAALASAITSLDRDRARLAAYGTAARQRIEKSFTLPQMVHAVEAAYASAPNYCTLRHT